MIALVAILNVLAISAALSHSGINSIPANFFKVVDEGGANDVPGQVDLTQMGRDDTDATKYKVFWSWDSTDQWTGTGQTGDACALFDSDGNTNIDFVVCGQIENPNADASVVRQTAGSTFTFTCTDKKNDRCTGPTPVPHTASQVASGVIGTLDRSATSNLITDTDPNGLLGTNQPHDATLEVDMLKTYLNSAASGTAVLVNVCSYPSAGNGGNNNPFDCIVTPGGGFLVIAKNAGSNTTTSFSFTVANPTATRTITGTGNTLANPIPVVITNNPSTSVTETVPANWSLTAISCKFADGTTSTGSVDLATFKVTGVAVQSGSVTTCTFTNAPVKPKLTVTKVVVNNNGGTKVVADFPLFVNTTGVTSGVQNEFDAGNYTVSETGQATYTATITGDCAADGTITLSLGDVKACTITNNDNAPSLTLNKIVTNDNGGTAAESDWTLTANGGTAGTLSGPGAAGSTDVVSGATFKAGTYALSESTGPAGYTASSWTCTGTGTQTGSSIALALGQTAVCTITNDDNKNTPSGSTTMHWKISDSASFTILAGATDADDAEITFALYRDDNGLDANTCTAANQVGSAETIGVTLTNAGATASAASSDVAVGAGTYYWIATYGGDQYNTGKSTTCGSEVTTITAQ